jgi:hypothetical protein
MTASFPFRIDAEGRLLFDNPDGWRTLLRSHPSSRGELVVHVPKGAERADPDLPTVDQPRRRLFPPALEDAP